MKFLTPFVALSLLTAVAPAFADSDVTTTTTTVQSTSVPEYFLPATGTYTVVDPAGVLVGKWLLGQPYTQGSYVVEKASGKVVAMVSTGGHLVQVSTIPSTYPAYLVVTDGVLVYSGNDYAKRRAILDAEISADYSAGRLTNSQVGKLKEKLARIAKLEAKRHSDNTYSTSTVKEIESDFAEVKGDMAKDVASTNTKKANMGIKVN